MTAPTIQPDSATQSGGADARSIRPRVGLPSGRAVVGALLVVLAAVGTFAAYLSSTTPPTTRYVVVTDPLRVGETITEADLSARFDLVALDLPDEQRDRLVRDVQIDQLVGSIVVADVAVDDLLAASALSLAGDAPAGVSVSFSISGDRAFAGRVDVGERLDLLGTFGPTTRVVARDVRVIDVVSGSGSGGAGIILTVLVPDLLAAEAVLAAADNGRLALTRGADPDEPTGPGTTIEGSTDAARPATPGGAGTPLADDPAGG